ncbi:hypothetical protein GCM10009801_75840 [Streptomyces albiaxialis]|uniref:Uncharacterized protein n=1 Tax=Streptomyces albiaxialis TaxID=329523 RepID=A0ABP5IKD2_9ACTN
MRNGGAPGAEGRTGALRATVRTTIRAALKRKLAGTGIRDLYVHAGPLEHDGTLRAVERELPGVRVPAWDCLRPLDRLRPAVHREGGVLSVATHQIDPLPGPHSAAGALTGRPTWWSQRYSGEVARRVDQVAVMSYDTALPLESLYGGPAGEGRERRPSGLALYADFAAADGDWEAYRRGWSGGSGS